MPLLPSFTLPLLSLGMSRTYPTTFRSILDLGGPPHPEEVGGAPSPLKVRCQCGAVNFSLPPHGQDDRGGNNNRQGPDLLRCHCRSCRKSTVAAFAPLLRVPTGSSRSVAAALGAGGEAGASRGRACWCDHFGEVERYHCGKCYSVLGLRCRAKVGEGEDSGYWVAMGAVVDDSVPTRLGLAWQEDDNVQDVCPDQRVAWLDAAPSQAMPGDSSSSLGLDPLPPVSGGCACGAVRYQCAPFAPCAELQHCYCRLCRSLSGAAFQTWVPCASVAFQWKSKRDGSLKFIRTTPHGRRHMCTECGSTLTIAYDDQEGIIWPAAGGFDDDSLPATTEEVSSRTSRAVHICCSMMQPWYRLPDDVLPRIKYVS